MIQSGFLNAWHCKNALNRNGVVAIRLWARPPLPPVEYHGTRPGLPAILTANPPMT
jgi:hypothetical protein